MAYGFNEDKSKVAVYTADQIDAMDLADDASLAAERARIDQLIDDAVTSTEVRTLLYDGSWGGGSVSLLDNANSYDCLEVHYLLNTNESKRIERIPVTGGMLCASQATNGNHGDTELKGTTIELQVASSGTSISIYDSEASWVSKTNDVISMSRSTGTFTIYTIYGIKYVSIPGTSPELTDIRVGADGTTHATAGDHVRYVEQHMGDHADEADHATLADTATLATTAEKANKLSDIRWFDGFRFDGSADVSRFFVTPSAESEPMKQLVYDDNNPDLAPYSYIDDLPADAVYRSGIFLVKFKNGHNLSKTNGRLNLGFLVQRDNPQYIDYEVKINGEAPSNDFYINPGAVLAFVFEVNNVIGSEQYSIAHLVGYSYHDLEARIKAIEEALNQ